MNHPEFTIEYLDPAALVAHPQNWRRHPEPQRRALQESLSDHGYLAAPIWNRQTGHLLDGHLRVDLARAQGEPRVPVRVIDVPAAQEKRILASFDRIGALALPDDAALAALLQELAESPAGLPAGWEDADLAGLLETLGETGGLLPDADPDAIPEAVETRCKAGQLWQLGEHRLLCGDSTRTEDVERLMGGEAVDAILTDPPYGLSSASRVQKRGDRIETFEVEWDGESCLGWIAPALSPLTAGGALICFWAAAQITGLWEALAQGDFHPLHTVYWRKTVVPQPRPNFCSCIEAAVFARKPGPVRCWNGGGATANVFECGRSVGAERTAHETQKPLALWSDLLALVTMPGFLVYDPFAGSGTTLIGCEQMGRTARCMEISPEFCDIIIARYEAATAQSAERLS